MRGGGGYSAFLLKNYGTKENPIVIGGMSGATLTCNSGKRIMSIGNNCYLRFENITFTGAEITFSGAYGGALYINGADTEITLSNGTRITGNTLKNNEECRGGGVAIVKGTLIISGAEISNNKVCNSFGSSFTGVGGGLFAGVDTVVKIYSGLITANTARSGGGICATGSTFAINGGTISANQGSSGGGLYLSSSNDGRNIPADVTINQGAKITANSAVGGSTYGNGGGVNVSSGTFTMNGGTISGNTADGSYTTSSGVSGGGGGIYAWNPAANVLINGGAIQNNNSLKHGGGIYVLRGSATYTSGTISGNTVGISFNGKSIYKDPSTGTVMPPEILTSGNYEDGNILDP